MFVNVNKCVGSVNTGPETKAEFGQKVAFLQLETFDQLAELLGIKPGFLRYVLRVPINRRYATFKLPKKIPGKERIIHSPIWQLKHIQSRLLSILEEVYTPRDPAYGFIKGRSALLNAKAHRKYRVRFVLNLDIQDFFPSIHYGRVRGLFMSHPYNLTPKIAGWLAAITCFEGGLPQGAPTSPIIANMICNKLDNQLRDSAKRHRCTYTRYADDITFSTSIRSFPPSLARYTNGQLVLGDELHGIIEDNGFTINDAKLRLQTSFQRQEVTGIVINRFTNVPQTYIRQVRAMLHDWQMNGLEAAADKHWKLRHKHRYPKKKPLLFKSVVRGKIEYLGMVRGKSDPIYLRYLKQLSELDSSVIFEETSMATKALSIFISYASEDKQRVDEIYQRLKGSGYNPWMDTHNIIGGEDWKLAINRAIDNADLCIIVLSKKYVNKRGVIQKEIKRALEKLEEKFESDIFIIPLRLEECEIPNSRIKDIHRIDYFESNGWNKLTQSIQASIRQMESTEE